MIVKYKLDNGLTILLEPIESVVSISIGLWIKTGSRNEKKDEYGFAHFIEHMLFKGTKNYSSKDIASMIDRVGGQHNAATNREYTCYFINVISDFLPLSINILSDMYYHSLFDTSEIKKEQNVIVEEISMYEDTPDEIIHDIFIASMLSSHPLGHSILGTIDSINKIKRKNLINFFHNFYQNNNCYLAIAGNFKVDQAKYQIEKYFSDSLNKNTNSYVNLDIAPNRIYRKHIEKDLEQIHFCIGTEGLPKGEDDRWALYALSTILGGSMSSRLFQNIREQEGLCYSIYSFHSSYSDTGIFGIYCGTSPENYIKVKTLILKECELLLKNGITEQELSDTKAFIKGNLALSLESTEVRMGRLARSEMIYNRYYSFNDIADQIDNLNLNDFNRVCNRLFRDKRLTNVSIGRLKESVLENESLYLQV